MSPRHIHMGPLLALLLVLVAVRPADGQSISTGALAGTVVGPEGRPLADARVVLRSPRGGSGAEAQTRSSGEFLFELVEPGEYELLVERLAYRPVILAGVPVVRNRRADVRVELEAATGAVDAVDRRVFEGGALLRASPPGLGRRYDDLELRSLPTPVGLADELLDFSTYGETGFAVEGLPSRMSGLTVDAVPFRTVTSPVGPAGLEALILPLRAVAQAELLAGRPDVEWPGAAGGLLAAEVRQGGGPVRGAVEGQWSSDALSIDRTGEAEPPFTEYRLGASVGGGFAADSGRAQLFVEAQQRPTSRRFWPVGSSALASDLVAAGSDIGALLRPGAGETTRLNLGAGAGWRFSGGPTVDVTALFGRAERDYLPSGLTPVDRPGTLDASDLLAVTTVTAPIAERLAAQLRLSYGVSSRELTAEPGPDTGYGDAAIGFAPLPGQLGGDPAYPADLQRSDLLAQATLYYTSGAHRLKAGGGVEISDHDRTAAHGVRSLYLFDGADGLRDGSGFFRGQSGGPATTQFSVADYFVYGQDTWRAAPGLDLVTGLRYEIEALPDGDLIPNTRWRELTGIDNAGVDGTVDDIAFVAGFDWDVAERGTWRLRGDVAVQVGEVAPELLAEALSYDGRIGVSTALGDVTEVTELGPRLTVLSPNLETPLTTRGSLGVSRSIGGLGALHLAAVLRQTDNLPVRTDLNRPIEPALRDQHDRPVYGPLAQVGSLLQAEPLLNRRFQEFDIVSGIASTASSTYWGLTTGIEKRTGAVEIAASYTYSETRDDWFGASAPAPFAAISPFPSGGELGDWSDGISDFDVPHRLSIAGALRVPFVDYATVGFVWNRASGRPFTPGFAPGIDANADGISGNDPAFIDDSIPGMTEALADWECLRLDSGRFARRNGCRARTRSALDLWAAIRLPRLGPVGAELRVDALAADVEGAALIDTALLGLDPDGEVATDPETGQVVVPLEVNPNFGRPLGGVRELPRLRISLRMVL